jgi:hypothetical protein
VLNATFDIELNIAFNKVMKPDREIIMDLGGAGKVAEMLGYTRFGHQRVQNWLVRGIPARVKLQHPEIFLSPLPAKSPVDETEA